MQAALNGPLVPLHPLFREEITDPLDGEIELKKTLAIFVPLCQKDCGGWFVLSFSGAL